MAKTAGQATTRTQQRAQPQHILWVVPDKPANISTGRQRIANGLRTRGHTVDSVADRAGALRAARNGYDVVMGTTAWLGAVAPLTDAAVVVDYVDPIDQLQRSCGRLERTAAYALHRNALRQADGVMYVYDRVASELPAGVETTKTSLGVDYDRFADPSPGVMAQADGILSQRGVTEDFAVYIGGLEPPYNIETMLSAAGQTDTDCQLVVAGTGSKQPAVETRASQREDVTYLGTVDHEAVPGLLAHASAGICLVDDAHTVKVLEYAAAGLPIVHITGTAQRRFDIPDIVWCENQPDSVGSAIDTALERAGGDALKRLAKAHDYARTIAEYDSMIQRVV